MEFSKSCSGIMVKRKLGGCDHEKPGVYFQGVSSLGPIGMPVLGCENTVSNIKTAHLDSISDLIEMNQDISNLHFRASFARNGNASTNRLKNTLALKSSNDNYSTDNKENSKKASGDLSHEFEKKEDELTAKKLLKGDDVKIEATLPAICTIDQEGFLQIATKSKKDALSLQLHIESCSEDCINKLAIFCQSHLDQLLVHSVGNYTVQKLINRSPRLRRFVVQHCKPQFKLLSANEFSSRVMQRLIEKDQSFCSFALWSFRANLDSYIQGFSSVFLVSVALKSARSDEERNIFSPRLLKNVRKSMAKKYFKRVLVSYISSCDQDSLPWIFKIITRAFSQPSDFLKDRYSALMMLAFIERQFKSMEEMLIQSLRYQTPSILQSEMFGYFLSQLGSRDGVDRFRSNLNTTLRSLPHGIMQSITADIRLYTSFSKAIIMSGHLPTPH